MKKGRRKRWRKKQKRRQRWGKNREGKESERIEEGKKSRVRGPTKLCGL